MKRLLLGWGFGGLSDGGGGCSAVGDVVVVSSGMLGWLCVGDGGGGCFAAVHRLMAKLVGCTCQNLTEGKSIDSKKSKERSKKSPPAAATKESSTKNVVEPASESDGSVGHHPSRILHFRSSQRRIRRGT
ncbi:Uncharacterized protein Fot_36574 [Forsythia ovata]|uniref:Uncharacterized protein n=1 Tax=Forsythia ovata TaxID=205694 RepID=A0ABD1SQG4_9LAMI